MISDHSSKKYNFLFISCIRVIAEDIKAAINKKTNKLGPNDHHFNSNALLLIWNINKEYKEK